MKTITKCILSMIIKLYWLLLHRLFQKKSNLSFDEAFKILDYYHHNTIDVNSIKAKHVLAEEYDLHIIIPAYNVEKYIKQCVDSVIKQKTEYSYFITIINDGSIDNTEEVLKKEFAGFENIEIIKQKNKGISEARNTGMEIIKGKYLMFLDSDDYLLDNCIQTLLDKAFKEKADVVQGGYIEFNDDGPVIKTYIPNSDEHDNNNLIGMPWGKVIKNKVFEKLNFPPHTQFEDSIFAYCIYPVYSAKYSVRSALYAYRKNSKSITSRLIKSTESIDHYWIMGMLWEWAADNTDLNTEMQMKMLRHMTLGYNRCRFLTKPIPEAGFVFLQHKYLDLFLSSDSLIGKYKSLDQIVRDGDYRNFAILSKFWHFL